MGLGGVFLCLECSRQHREHGRIHLCRHVHFYFSIEYRMHKADGVTLPPETFHRRDAGCTEADGQSRCEITPSGRMGDTDIPGLSRRQPGCQDCHPCLGIIEFQRVAHKCDDIHSGIIRQVACDRMNVPARHNHANRCEITCRKRPCKGNQFVSNRQDAVIGQFGNDNDFVTHMRPLKNGFAAAQKSFSLQRCSRHMMIKNKLLTSILERRKTFDSPLANHFSPVMENSHIKARSFNI
jgi:hypothetical protein